MANDSCATNYKLKELMKIMKPINPQHLLLIGSKGHDLEKVYGLELCRVGASALDCASCSISDATIDILERCPTSKVGTYHLV